MRRQSDIKDTAEYAIGVRFFIEYGNNHPRFRHYFTEHGAKALVDRMAALLSSESPNTDQYGMHFLSSALAQGSYRSWAQGLLLDFEVCDVLAKALRYGNIYPIFTLPWS